MHSILVVDDEFSIRESFSLILEGKYRVFLSASGEAALKAASSQKIDLVYLDIRMPGLDGLETLKRLKEIDPRLEIIMITAVNEVQKASEAVKLGARDYVVKPFDVDQILRLTEQILRKKSILSEGTAAQKKIQQREAELIGQSDKILNLQRKIEKLKRDERVLIIGEAGTEKEEVASLIHEKSRRKELPFKSLSLSTDLTSLQIKTLLFGKEKGMSTVALKAQSGLLEQSRGGTLFIDNLECVPEEIFSALSASSFSRLGSSAPIPLETRLIGGAAQDLSSSFFAEAVIEVPPLRERIADIPIIVNCLIEKFTALYKKGIKLSAAAEEALNSYSWPGNARELEAVIERLFLASSSQQLLGYEEITLENLPLDIVLKAPGGQGGDFISAFEKEYIRSVFEKSNRETEKTALKLGVSPALLETKL